MSCSNRSKHPRSASFVETRLFDVAQFSELESRISALPTTNERGDAFEVFAEAYFATQKIAQAKQVWPFDALPLDVSQALSLETGRDMGVDGVYEIHAGDHNAYQVKFRSSRSALTWDELSTFMGLTDQVSQRVLFTNCNDFPELLNDRTDFFCIRGNDLDRLEPRDFKAIQRWLESGVVEVERKTPLLHQQEALNQILPALSKADRATAVMACGSGKTLLALWVAEQMAIRRILVLVPSLALLRQTLHTWIGETSWLDFSYLCVCSDPTVSRGVDELLVHQADLDFPVTTDAATVREYLTRVHSQIQVVFSTYQSAQVIAGALTGGKRFDLGIFDEAHKTAGREGTKFGFALTDEHLPIQKRLFLTATPRHYNVRSQTKEGEAKLVYSMDDSDTYGERVYTLSFGEAAKRGIICDYKVVISIATTDMVNDELLRRGEVLVEGDLVKAQQVANQVALQKAIEQYPIHRIFSFHRNVASAKNFVAKGGEGIEAHLPTFSTYHVNGTMRTAVRDGLITAFSKAPLGIMTNARCLTEGVDVPAVDMVAFLSPKKSKVDIVQATGRAMRKASGKECGYVLVPLYIEQEQGESLADALARTEFDEVWNVLQAMKEQDEELADIISQIRQSIGRTKGYDDQRFREKVAMLGPEIHLDDLRASITTTIVERLGTTWDERFGTLVAYKEKYGDCNVPMDCADTALANWVNNQRAAYRKRILNHTRRARLEDLGFLWNPYEAQWEQQFDSLKRYRSRYGDCHVPKTWDEDPVLASWVNRQRNEYTQGKISDTRRARLEAVGFAWDRFAAQWEKSFAQLKEYRDIHGDCHVPRRWEMNPTLAIWVAGQRARYRSGKLDASYATRLKDLGFELDPYPAKWEESFNALRSYLTEHGDCNVPRNWPRNPKLASWVTIQRSDFRSGRLNAERKARLDALNFVWDPINEQWERQFRALQRYRKEHGDCNVPRTWADAALSTWVNNVRARKHKLRDDQLARLDGLGFEWDSQRGQWESKFALLLEFKARHGNCDVPNKWPDNRKLANWVGNQRAAFKKGKLDTEKCEQLEAAGFNWDPASTIWEAHFAALQAYKAEYGTCYVPRDWNGNPTLGRWVTKLRSSYANGTLGAERVARLEAKGFVWDPYAAEWAEMFRTLKLYKAEFGDCDVPASYSANRALGRWVSRQRGANKAGKLKQEYRRLLDDAGFIWDRKSEPRKSH